MQRPRFRIRTIMFAIVVSAVALVLVRVLTPSGLEAWAGFEGSNLVIQIGVPEQEPESNGYAFYLSITKIHIVYVVAVAAIAATLFGLAVHGLSLRLRASLAILDVADALKAKEIGPTSAEAVQAQIEPKRFIDLLG